MADIERLPGLAQAGKLPFLPDLGGMRDFSKVTARNVAQFAAKYPTVAAASVVLPLSALGINVLPPLKFAVPTTDGKLFGFPLAGELTFQLGIRKCGAVLENWRCPGVQRADRHEDVPGHRQTGPRRSPVGRGRGAVAAGADPPAR